MGQLAPHVLVRPRQDSRRCMVRAFEFDQYVRYLFTILSATALQSLEIACETIQSGKAKIMIAGGFDDFSEEGSYEFANMGATSNTHTEFAMGREPGEMSRPTASTRDGVSAAFCIVLLELTFWLSSWKHKVVVSKSS